MKQLTTKAIIFSIEMTVASTVIMLGMFMVLYMGIGLGY